MLLMCLLGMSHYFEHREVESLLMIRQMLRLSTQVPDHKVTIELF